MTHESTRASVHGSIEPLPISDTFHVRNHQERLTQAPPTVIARNVLLSASAAWTITPGHTSHYMWVDSASVIRRKLRRINNLSRHLTRGIGVN